MTTPNLGLFFTACIVMLFVACKKETSFKYKATCDNCKISYYDEKGTFIVREDYAGTFEKEISVEDFSPIMMSVRSSVCAESTDLPNGTNNCDSALFINDVIMIEISKSSEVIFRDTASGKPLQAISYSYDWQK